MLPGADACKVEASPGEQTLGLFNAVSDMLPCGSCILQGCVACVSAWAWLKVLASGGEHGAGLCQFKLCLSLLLKLAHALHGLVQMKSVLSSTSCVQACQASAASDSALVSAGRHNQTTMHWVRHAELIRASQHNSIKYTASLARLLFVSDLLAARFMGAASMQKL